MPLTVPVLVGSRLCLEPLAESHVAGLAAAGAEERSTYGFTGVPHGPVATEAYVVDLLAAAARGEIVPFAQVPADGTVVGATRYLDLRSLDPGSLPYAVEVGGTWLAASAQRSGWTSAPTPATIAPAPRSPLWAPSCVLRSAQPSRVPGEEGLLRHTALFSVVVAEWPPVRDRLTARLT